MINKSDTVRRLIINGDYKKALGIAKGFQLGISKEESNRLILAHECMTNPRFYKELGTDTERAITDGIRVLLDLYGQSE